MNQRIIYFSSTIIGAVLSYLINQLPGISEPIKPWLTIPVIGLTVLSAWLGIKLSQSSLKQTSVSRNKVKGKENKVRGIVGANVDENDVDGEKNEISIGSDIPGNGPNP